MDTGDTWYEHYANKGCSDFIFFFVGTYNTNMMGIKASQEEVMAHWM